MSFDTKEQTMFNTPQIAVAGSARLAGTAALGGSARLVDGSAALALGSGVGPSATDRRLSVIEGEGRGAVSWWTAAAIGIVVFLAVVAGARLADAGDVSLEAPPVAVVVQPGDSVWTVVRSVIPDGDVRSVVAQIHAEREGRLLQPGDVVFVPAGS